MVDEPNTCPREGLGGATIGAITNMLKAPPGSIYHRFASRDVLLGRLG